MAIKEAEPNDALAQVAGHRHRFSRQEYHAMAQAGILGEHSRVELIEGEIIEMSPINPPHSGLLRRITAVCYRKFLDRAVIAVQDPLAGGEFTELQPDLCLLKPRDDYYAQAHPAPADIVLLIEVSDSSLRYDRTVKLPLYAAWGIAESWIVNVPERMVEVYRDPSPKGYRSLQKLAPGDAVSPLAFPDVSLDVAAILPPAAEQ